MCRKFPLLRSVLVCLALIAGQAQAEPSPSYPGRTADIVTTRAYFLSLRQEAKEEKKKGKRAMITTMVLCSPMIPILPLIPLYLLACDVTWHNMITIKYPARSRKGIKILQAAWTLQQPVWPSKMNSDLAWSEKKFEKYYRRYVRLYPGTHPSARLGKRELMNRLSDVANVLFALEEIRQRTGSSKVVTYLRNRVTQKLPCYTVGYPMITDKLMKNIWPLWIAAVERGAKNAGVASEVTCLLEELLLPPQTVEEYLMMLNRMNEILSSIDHIQIESNIMTLLRKQHWDYHMTKVYGS